MRTEKQRQASRANGRRSHGPATPEGKATSSQNAFRHGLLAKTIVLAHEDKQCFQQYIDQHMERFPPADEVEMNLIEEAVSAAWRERRCADLITIAMDTAIEDIEPTGDPRRDLLRGFNHLAATPTLKLLQRYETRYHLMYHRCINTLIKLQKNRPAPEPNEPGPVVPNEPESDPIAAPLRPSLANILKPVVPSEPGPAASNLRKEPKVPAPIPLIRV